MIEKNHKWDVKLRGSTQVQHTTNLCSLGYITLAKRQDDTINSHLLSKVVNTSPF